MPHQSTILIIEREQPIRELLTEVLADEGYRTHEAATGRDGLAALAREQPALTMLGMALADVRAKEIIHAIQSIQSGDIREPTVMRLVLMSTQPESAAPLLVPGTIECLAMPFELGPLITLVARLVEPQADGAVPPR
jgi:DNA-binding NtrC family response regulator